MSKPIYAIGHRNPDTDSICSAIAYAHLKQALGENVVPARAGKINPETKFVLEQLHVQPPLLIDDLYPRVKDVMREAAVRIHPEDTLRELGVVMRQFQAKSIPVVEGEDHLVGMVSGGDLANRYFEELELQDLCEAGTDFCGIVRVLGGTLITGENLSRKVTGKVRIAAARTETMRHIVRPGDVVLVGDRVDSQLACLRMGAACLVITGGVSAPPEVVEEACRQGAIVIEAPQDTFTCGRLINQSIPVRMIMHEEVITFRPDDLITDIKETIVRSNHRNYPVVENGRLAGMITRDGLIVPDREKIILVDHNEHNQAVEGIEAAQIVEIIDHHRLGGLVTSEPIFIRHEPVGSTATIVTAMFRQHGVAIVPQIAGLLLSALLSDTVLFKSPTATAKDRETGVELAKIAGLDLETFGMAVLKAGSKVSDLSPAEIVNQDLKEFSIGDYHVSISQISVMDSADVLTIQAELRQALESLRGRGNYDLAALMVTDIMKEATCLLYAGQPVSLLRKAFGEESEEGLFQLPGVMSRKKQVVPPLSEAAKSQQ